MNIEFLKQKADKFAYELRKFWHDDEKQITHYVTAENVVVLSSKKCYVFYVDTSITYSECFLNELVIQEEQEHTCIFSLKDKKFVLEFANLHEKNECLGYIEKYKSDTV